MPPNETVPCPLCDGWEARTLYTGDGWVLGRCRGCGLVRQNPRWTAAAFLEEHYAEQVYEQGRLAARHQAYEGLKPWQPLPLEGFAEGVAEVERHRVAAAPRGTWLDVGAATGSLLVAAREAGWSVRGVEPGRRQARLCRDALGLEVFQGILREAAFPENSAEVVSYRHVLEHIHDPGGELAEVRRILSPKGLLLVEVPNFDGERYRWGRLRTSLRLCRPFYARLNLPEHLYYFTARTLRLLLDRQGFEVLSRRTYGRTRQTPSRVRRAYDRFRNRIGTGNSLRMVFRPR